MPCFVLEKDGEKKKRETNPVGENLFVCLPVWAHTITEVVIAMNKIVVGVQQLEKNKESFLFATFQPRYPHLE